ncbi:MAG TPA: D-alanine--D-alanine ligase [Phaeodactylibacter sp.]|nr:D-alanine--D-alanine ligase [Phaeodactylibacter sp.]
MQTTRLKVGIFFGGPSREREISFAGGRTVYDNLDRSLFEPVPVFVDSYRRLILLDWPYIYKGTIRDFYPPASALPDSPHHFQMYVESLGELSGEAWREMARQVGRPLEWAELPGLIDLAFLALHGEFGEDGQIQGLLSSLDLPYTGSGLRACAIGMDKGFQKKLMDAGGFACPEMLEVKRDEWFSGQCTAAELYRKAKSFAPGRIVVRPANQGSSIGVSILPKGYDERDLAKAIDKAFFKYHLPAEEWLALEEWQRIQHLRQLSDLREGPGFPMLLQGETVFTPEELLEKLNALFADGRTAGVTLESYWLEQSVILESFIEGREFSCIVLRREEDGRARALPPTEIIKMDALYDYRSKYLPGLSRKETPIHLPEGQIEALRRECERLFDYLGFGAYARIDGFLGEDGRIYLNDPNTTSGMLPSSFFFHQAAEIGLTPSRFLTYIIAISLRERRHERLLRPLFDEQIERLEELLRQKASGEAQKTKIAVLLGGYSFERHISVESGRNIFEKLASSDKYEPIPVFLAGEAGHHRLFILPIRLLLKDNADDIRQAVLQPKSPEVLLKIRSEFSEITRKYADPENVFEPVEISYEELAQKVDGVFIALHGRPGEDGEVQQQLERLGLPYNGSPPSTAALTIDKYATLQRLREAGFPVTRQQLLSRAEYVKNPLAFRQMLLAPGQAPFAFPFVLKPVDDGCSSAVMIIRNEQQLEAYLRLFFREEGEKCEAERKTLGLKPQDEFPAKDQLLIEELIRAAGAEKFMEITCGLMTYYDEEGQLQYQVFEPSEALVSGEVLSLEEKFLAGEGQNITPARFADNPADYEYIARQVKDTLERAARLLGIEGYARIDAFVRIYPDKRAETVIIEVNSLPGMTPATCIYHQAAIEGMKPFDFIDKLIQFGFRRKTAKTV